MGQNVTETIPLILPRSLFDGDVYDPIQGLIHQINHMMQEGFGQDTLPDDLLDLYLLDYLVAQVKNGGFSQFIHNSHGNLATNLTRALSAARPLEQDALEQIIQDCEDWVRANPAEAAQQDGFDTRADALEPLDSRLYSLVFSTADLCAYLKALPQRLRRMAWP